MKVSTVNAVVSILSGIRLNRIADKRVKSTLLNGYLSLRKIVKEADERRADLVRKFQADWDDELDAVEAMRREGRPVTGHDAYLEAERDANALIEAVFAEDVEVSVQPVPLQDFMSACKDEELTMEQVAFLMEQWIVS